jgi:hypothetical protein
MDQRPNRRLGPRRSNRPATVAVAALLFLAALPLPLLAATQPGAESPQALVARLKAAAQKNDFGELVDCIAPTDRREMAAGLVLGTTMMVAFMDMGSDMAMGMAQGMAEGVSGSELTAEQKAEMEKGKAEAKAKTAELRGRYEAILQRHGLKDRMEALQAEGGETSGGSPEEAIGKLLAGVDERALITDLMGFMSALGESQGQEEKKPIDLPGEVTDYKIDGDHATAKAGDETVRFVKVDGRWYFEPSKDKGAER